MDIFTNELYIFKPGKKARLVHKGSPLLASLVDSLRPILSTLVHSELDTNRIRQSRLDLECLDSYPFAQYIDIKDAFPSLNVGSLIKDNDEVLTFEEKKLLYEIYSSPIINRHGESIIPEIPFARPGLSLSNTLMELALTPLFNEAPKYNIKILAYCDDIALYAHTREDLQNFLSFAAPLLQKIGLHFYDESRPEKNSGALDLSLSHHCGERLGLFFYKQKGKVYSKLRTSTKKKYFSKLKKLNPSLPLEINYEKIHNIFLGKNGLYHIFPHSIWTCPLDRRLFEITAFKIIKRRLNIKDMSSLELKNQILKNGAFDVFNFSENFGWSCDLGTYENQPAPQNTKES